MTIQTHDKAREYMLCGCVVWCGMVWCCMVSIDTMWCVVVWYSMVECGVEWCDVAWYSIVLYDEECDVK